MNKKSPARHHVNYRQDGTIQYSETRDVEGNGAEVFYYSDGRIGMVRYCYNHASHGPQLNFNKEGEIESVTTWGNGDKVS